MPFETNPVLGVSSEQEGLNKIQSLLDRGLMGDDFASEEPTPDEDAPVEEVKDEEEADEAPDTDEEDTDVEEDESEEADDSEDEEPDVYTLTIGDEEVKVNLDEMKKGYLRQSDYTRKTQALADERKGIAAEKEEATKAKAQAQEYLQFAQVMALADLEPFKDVKWDELKRSDEFEYNDKRSEYNDAVDRYNKALNAIQTYQKEQAEQQHKDLVAYAAKEMELLQEKDTDFLDKESRESVTSKLKQYAQAQGFSEQELAGVYDHRTILLLKKAMLYDEIKSKGSRLKDKKVDKAPRRLVRKGETVNKAEETAKQKRSAFKQKITTGSREDIARHLASMMPDDF